MAKYKLGETTNGDSTKRYVDVYEGEIPCPIRSGDQVLVLKDEDAVRLCHAMSPELLNPREAQRFNLEIKAAA